MARPIPLLSLTLLAVWAPSVSGALNVVVGSAGCDGADPQCRPPAAANLLTTLAADGAAGTLRVVRNTAVGAQPAWAVAPGEGSRVYAALLGDSQLAAYDVAAGSGVLRPVGAPVACGGTAPAHFTLSRDQRYLLVANYGGCDNCTAPDGSVSVMQVASNGAVGDVVQVVPHTGRGTDPTRQNCAHVHSVYPHPTADVVYALDLGVDTITAYAFADGRLAQIAVAPSTRPGAGPRHLAFHPTLPVAYVLEEMASAVGVYEIEANGALSFASVVSTSDGAVGGGRKAAEVVLTAGGGYLYASNRGSCGGCNSVRGFAVDAATGALTPLAATPTRRFPRGMAVARDPADGVEYLFVAGQGDGTLTQYRIEGDGALVERGSVAGLNTPATIAFY